MISIAICDDQKESLNSLHKKILDLFDNENFKINIKFDLYIDAEEFMATLMNGAE